jgi:hypothetical protein
LVSQVFQDKNTREDRQERGREMSKVIDFRISKRNFGPTPTPEQLGVLRKVFAIARLCHKLGMSNEERQKVLNIINDYTGIPVGIEVSTSIQALPGEEGETETSLLSRPNS